jgi:hypothetical protein
MPRLSEIAANTATRIAGVAAMAENITTRRICSFDPAAPLLRSIQRLVSRQAMRAPSVKTSERSTRIKTTTTVGLGL